MELCLNPDLIDTWKRLVKKEARKATKHGESFDPLNMLEVRFLRNLMEEFLEILDCKVFLLEQSVNGDDVIWMLTDWHRYLRPLVSDVAVVPKCHLSALYRHEKGKLFAQLVDLLQSL